MSTPEHPPTPERVRLVYTDGTESEPLPVLYLGQSASGMALWEAMAPPPDDRTPSGLRVGVMPPRTTVRMAPPDPAS